MLSNWITDPDKYYSLDILPLTQVSKMNNISHCMWSSHTETSFCTTLCTANFPPSLSGRQLFNVTVGYVNVYPFFASDDQDEAIDVYVVSSWQPYGVLEPVADSPGYYMFTVDLTEVTAAEFLAANVHSLVFSASDSLGTYGELNPRVVVYPCTSNGNATALGEVMAQGTTEFLYCECSEGLTNTAIRQSLLWWRNTSWIACLHEIGSACFSRKGFNYVVTQIYTCVYVYIRVFKHSSPVIVATNKFEIGISKEFWFPWCRCIWLGSDVVGYDGQFCEGDRDDCVQQPCGEEAECVDNPAPMVGVTCVCPDGFNITEDGTRCLGTCAGHAVLVFVLPA